MGGSSKSGGASSKQYDYFGDCAAILCNGLAPGDAILGVIVDKEQVWTGPVEFVASSPGAGQTTANPYRFTVTGYGAIDFYWGTESQTLAADSSLLAANNDLSEDHPPYRGICFIELRQFLFGLERQQPPDIQVVVRRSGKQTILTAPATQDNQVNPFVFLAEMLEDRRFGLATRAEKFASESWQSAATAAAEDAEKHYITVRQTDQVEARALLKEVFAICDGYLRHDETTGRIEAAKWPEGADIDVDELPVIDYHDLSDSAEPETSPEDWGDVASGGTVVFRDRLRAFKETSESDDNPVALLNKDEPERRNLKRHMVRRASQAKRLASWYARLYCVAGFSSGQRLVRRAKTEDLRAGQLVRIDVDHIPGGDQVRQVSRILAISGGDTGPREVSFEPERTLAPSLYSPGADVPENPQEAEPDNITQLRVIELPPYLVGGREFHLGVFARRPQRDVTDFAVYYDPDDEDGDFPEMGRQRTFAIRGELLAGYAADASGALTVEITGVPTNGLLDSDPGETAARNDDVLLFLVRPDPGSGIFPDYDSDGFGIVEAFSVESLSGGLANLSITAYRGRLGTLPRAWVTGDEIWIMRRNDMRSYYHQDFPGLQASAQSAYLKIQPISGQFGPRQLANVTTHDFDFAGGRAYAPRIAWTAPGVDPTVSQTASAAASIVFTGVCSDQDGDLISVQLYSRPASGGEITYYDQRFSPRTAQEFSASVPFPSAGTYYVTARGQDAAGRITESTWTVLVDFDGGVQLGTPTFSPSGGSYTGLNLSVTISASGANYLIKWATTNLGEPAPTVWTDAASANASAVVSIPLNKRLWAYVTDPTETLTDSDGVGANYYRESRDPGGGWIIP